MGQQGTVTVVVKTCLFAALFCWNYTCHEQDAIVCEVFFLLNATVCTNAVHFGCVLACDMFCMFFACRRREYSRFHGCMLRDTAGTWRKMLHSSETGPSIQVQSACKLSYVHLNAHILHAVQTERSWNVGMWLWLFKLDLDQIRFKLGFIFRTQFNRILPAQNPLLQCKDDLRSCWHAALWLLGFLLDVF